MTPLPPKTVIDRLETLHGRPELSMARSPFELIVWENVAYLADDARRQKAFVLLRDSTGMTAQGIAAADDETLMAVARHGIVPEQTVGKLRRIAEVAMSEFAGDVDAVVALPTKEAMKALHTFPAIGKPAAEKILMMNGVLPVLALESNGLRVLQRIGYALDTGNYDRDYRAMRAVTAGISEDCEWLSMAHLLLRRHGQSVCRRSTPECGRCPLVDGCAYFSATDGTAGS